MRFDRATPSSRTRQEALTAYLFIAPAALLVGAFGLFPVLFTMYVSLWKWRIRRDTFVGLQNYVDIFGAAGPLLLFLLAMASIVAGLVLLRRRPTLHAPSAAAAAHPAVLRILAGAVALAAGTILVVLSLPAMYGVAEKEMLDSLRVTIWYSLGTVPVQLAAGVVVAVLINQKVPGRQAFRVIYLLPWVVPSVASAAVFERLFSLRPESLANQVLKLLGLPIQEWLQEPEGVFTLVSGGRIPLEGASAVATYWLSWAQGPSLALVSILIYSWWVFIGYYALIYTNGLSGIPRQLYEAAEVDGAGKIRSFFRITLPMLSPTTYFLTLLGVIGTFKAFTHVYVLRTPAVRGAVDSMSVYIFFEFFRKQRFGFAAALSLVLFVIVVGLTVLQRRIAEKSVTYGD